MSQLPVTTDPRPSEDQEQKLAVSAGNEAPNRDELSDVLHLVTAGNTKLLFDLGAARKREAERRRKTMGEFALHDFDKQRFRAFALERYVPEKALTTWKQNFLLHGLDGLLPQDWHPLKEQSQQKVIERLKTLGKLTEAEIITEEDMSSLVSRLGGSWRKADRLVRRYQIDGVWGLAPEYDPERFHRVWHKGSLIDFAAATPKSRAEAERRLALITPYIGKRRITNEELRVYAEQHSTEEHSLSWRTMRDYLFRYKKWGLVGLLPKEERSDKGHPHNMTPLMEDIIAAVRFSQMDIPLHEVQRQAAQRARLLGEPEPTPWQVRYICDHIPDEVKLVADKRFGEFRSKRRLTYRFHFDGSVIIFQIDFTPVDVLLRDIRRRGRQTQSKEFRPYLITCMEASSRLVLAWLLTYDVPNSNNIAAVIRDALIVSDEKPYGGIPHAIWVDGGKQLVSHHIQRIAQDLHFELKEGKPNHPEDRGDPQERGIVERFFETLNTELWSTLDGYVHSNTKERNPNAKATLTISELAAKLKEFIDKYHHKEHSETKETPLAFWAKHCQARPPDDDRRFDILMLVAETRKLTKPYITYGTRRYWHDDLAEIPVGTKVEIRAQADYMRPDTIEVFYQKRHVCTAFAHDSVQGRAVTGKRVLEAQREQMRRIKKTIKDTQTTLHNADRIIESQGVLVQQDQPDEQATIASQQPKEQPSEAVAAETKRVASTASTDKQRVPPRKPPTARQRNAAWANALAASKRHQQQQEEGSKP